MNPNRLTYFSSTICAWALAATVLGVGPAAAQLASAPVPAASSPVYQSVPAGRDGIGKRFMGRDIAGVMGFEGAAWLERVEREKEERSDVLMQELSLRPGMVVADVGAGSGYYSRRLASAVGLNGTVFAADVQPQMVALLTKTAQQPAFSNIRPVLATEQDVRLPAASLDLAIMVDVYHELAYPQEVMNSLVRALKPGGRVVFVEYRAEDDAVPIKALHKMSEAQIKSEASLYPLVWERTAHALPWQHVVIFRKK